jgi:hypothetical protein
VKGQKPWFITTCCRHRHEGEEIYKPHWAQHQLNVYTTLVQCHLIEMMCKQCWFNQCVPSGTNIRNIRFLLETHFKVSDRVMYTSFPIVLQEPTDTLCPATYLSPRPRPNQVTPGCDPGPLVLLSLGAWAWFVGPGVWCIGRQIRRANLFVVDSFTLQTGPWSQITPSMTYVSPQPLLTRLELTGVHYKCPQVPCYWSHWTLCEWDAQQTNCTLCSLGV